MSIGRLFALTIFGFVTALNFHCLVVIVSVNGNEIEDVDQIQQQVDTTGINNTMQITVDRNGNTQQLTIRPQALPAQQSSQR